MNLKQLFTVTNFPSNLLPSDVCQLASLVNMSSVDPITVIGQGYSIFRGSAINSVLSGETSTSPASAVEASIHVCTKTEDVLDALNINASAEVSCS